MLKCFVSVSKLFVRQIVIIKFSETKPCADFSSFLGIIAADLVCICKGTGTSFPDKTERTDISNCVKKKGTLEQKKFSGAQCPEASTASTIGKVAFWKSSVVCPVSSLTICSF